jgi:hypothetical protein
VDLSKKINIGGDLVDVDLPTVIGKVELRPRDLDGFPRIFP